MRRTLPFAAAGLMLVLDADPAHASSDPAVIDARSWRILTKESGPVNYYTTVEGAEGSYVHARYVPPLKTAVLGYQMPDGDRRRVRKLRWTWRAVTLPAGGDECNSSKADSAAVVYITWKSGLRYHTLKYAWSSVGTQGKTCDRKRNLFVAQDTIILESGHPGEWRTEEIDLDAEYRRHFENGDPKADVPDLMGIGIMTDGDQTRSESAADYGPFTIIR